MFDSPRSKTKKPAQTTLIDPPLSGDDSDLSSYEAAEAEEPTERKRSQLPLGGSPHKNPEKTAQHNTIREEDKTFFREDEDDDKEHFKNQRYTSDKNYYRERQLYEVEISLPHFFTYFIYHLTFVFTIGPFMVIFFLLSKRRKEFWNIFNNIMFVRFSSIRFWILLLWWLCNVLIIGGYYFNIDYNSQFASSVIVYSMVTNSLVRIFSISANYATLSTSIQNLMMKERLSSETMAGEDMLGSWSVHDHRTIIDNIKAAVFASHIESSIMWINFMANPCEKVERHIEKLHVRSSETHNCWLAGDYIKVVELSNPKRVVRYFNTLTIFFYLLIRSNAKVYAMWAVSIAVGIVKTFGPYLLTMNLKKESPFKNTQEFCITLAINLFLLYLNTHNIAYFLLAIMDLNRKNSISEQLSNINSIHKTQGNFRYLPMVNFLDFASLWSWKSMLAINRNYGKKYFIRHQMFLAFVLVVTVTNYYVLKKVLENTDKIEEESFESIGVCFFIYFDLLSFYGMFLTLLIKAGNFNEFYSDHQYKIQTKVLILERIRLFQKHYVKNQAAEPEKESERNSLIPRSTTNQLFSDQISNSLLKALCGEIGAQVPSERVDYHLEQLIKYHKTMNEDLSNENATESMRIIGIKISKQIIQSVVLFCMPFALELHHKLCLLIWGTSPFHL